MRAKVARFVLSSWNEGLVGDFGSRVRTFSDASAQKSMGASCAPCDSTTVVCLVAGSLAGVFTAHSKISQSSISHCGPDYRFWSSRRREVSHSWVAEASWVVLVQNPGKRNACKTDLTQARQDNDSAQRPSERKVGSDRGWSSTSMREEMIGIHCVIGAARERLKRGSATGTVMRLSRPREGRGGLGGRPGCRSVPTKRCGHGCGMEGRGDVDCELERRKKGTMTWCVTVRCGATSGLRDQRMAPVWSGPWFLGEAWAGAVVTAGCRRLRLAEERIKEAGRLLVLLLLREGFLS